jgi:hypothetical protein
VFPLIVLVSTWRVAAALSFPTFRIAPASPPSPTSAGARLPEKVLRVIVSVPPMFATPPPEFASPATTATWSKLSEPRLFRMLPPKWLFPMVARPFVMVSRRSVARPLAVTLNTRSVPSPVSMSPSCLTVTVRAEAPTISSSELIASAVLRVRW